MSGPLVFRPVKSDTTKTTSMLTLLADELIVDALKWRAGIAVGEDGPTVGATATADITYDPTEIGVLVPVLIDDALILDDSSLDPDGVEQDSVETEAAVDESGDPDPWQWLRAVASGSVGGEDERRLAEVLDPAFDRSGGLREIDEVVAAIIGFWAVDSDGCARIASWACERETERRVGARRLEGLRRRYDRDLLVMADKISRAGPVT